MAKIVEDILIVKFSRIVKNGDSDPSPALTAVEQVAQELVGEGVVVEVEMA